MRVSTNTIISIVALVILWLDLATALGPLPIRRQNGGDVAITSTETNAPPSPSESSAESASNIDSSSVEATTITPTNTPTSLRSTTVVVTPTAASTDIQESQSMPSSNARSTQTEVLPIQPKVTPAMGLAGVILLITGLVYSVTGIKSKWLYIFFSSAYLASLAVTVLIVYLMHPTVSDAVQGGFFVAVIVTGAIFGALSILFPEVTDGLACLLGGFCLSMWFLSLKSGGLIGSTAGRAAFICVMSFAFFALSFTHYTRTYGQIGSIAFGGATAAVLGIDCFSRAGLKEFWLYLWDLNDDIFPLGTDTYPMTRGIRVEIACIVLFSLIGLISQMKLWKVVKERREKKSADRHEKEKRLERLEEEVGRRVEDGMTRERAEWEARYGQSAPDPQDSGIGSSNESVEERSFSIKDRQAQSPAMSTEMIGLDFRNYEQNQHAVAAAITVTDVSDNSIEYDIDAEGRPVPDQLSRQRSALQAPPPSPRPSNEASEQGDGRASPFDPIGLSLRSSLPPPPPVIALPFTIPIEDTSESEDRLSTSAEPEEPVYVHEQRSSKRRSIMSIISMLSASKRSSMYRISVVSGSAEALVVPHEDDRASSVAATLDEDCISLAELSDAGSLPKGESEEGEEDDMETPQPSTGAANEETGSLPEGPAEKTETEAGGSSMHEAVKEKDITQQQGGNAKSSELDTTYTDQKTATKTSQAEKGDAEKTSQPVSLTVSTDPKPETNKAKSVSPDTSPSTNHDDSKPSTSRRGSEAASRSGLRSIRDIAPERISKVVLSYRTNEWAKHLETAERPGIDELDEPESPGVKVEQSIQDRAAPVRGVEEATLRALEGKPPLSPITTIPTKSPYSQPSASRSGSVLSRRSIQPHPAPSIRMSSRNSSSPAFSSPPSSLRVPGVPVFPGTAATTSTPPGSLVRMKGIRSSSASFVERPVLEAAVGEAFHEGPGPRPYVSPMPSSTLLSKRETMMRNRLVSTNLNQVGTSVSWQPMQAMSNAGDAVSIRSGVVGAEMGADSSPDEMTLAQRKALIQHQQVQQQRLGQNRHVSWREQFDSHQPKRVNGFDSSRRETMLANWREGMRQELQRPGQVAVVADEGRRAAMLHDQRQRVWQQQQQAMAVTQRDLAFDEMMRRGDMMDLHREVMRRMQATANRQVS